MAGILKRKGNSMKFRRKNTTSLRHFSVLLYTEQEGGISLVHEEEIHAHSPREALETVKGKFLRERNEAIKAVVREKGGWVVKINESQRLEPEKW